MKKPDDYSVEDKEKPKFDVALKVDEVIRASEIAFLGEMITALSHVPPDVLYTVKLQITKAHK